MRWFAVFLLAIGLTAPAYSYAGEIERATVYKDPQCGCCEGYVAYLRENGFDVTAVDSHDLSLIKKRYGVPEPLEGCHTTIVGGYVVEGHVPASALKRLLAEEPAIKGISLPGMPEGSPGMTGTKRAPFTIYSITGDGDPQQVFATE
jgi:hypothetical protein